MADLTAADLDRFVEKITPVIARVTGLPLELAAWAAVSTVPPCEHVGEDSRMIVLRGENDEELARVSMDDLDPYQILDSLDK